MRKFTNRIKQTNTRYGDMWYFHEDPTIGRSSISMVNTARQNNISQYFTNSESIVVDIGTIIGTHTLGVCQIRAS